MTECDADISRWASHRGIAFSAYRPIKPQQNARVLQGLRATILTRLARRASTWPWFGVNDVFDPAFNRGHPDCCLYDRCMSCAHAECVVVSKGLHGMPTFAQRRDPRRCLQRERGLRIQSGAALAEGCVGWHSQGSGPSGPPRPAQGFQCSGHGKSLHCHRLVPGSTR